MSIEKVTPDDTLEILEIYAPYVLNTAISFEWEVPSVDDFRKRIEGISEKYPYLKYVEDGKILGYAYADAFKWRKAYEWSVESTIYLRPEAKRMKIGTKLYDQLENSLKEMGILNMNACIAVPKENDPRAPFDSIGFHEARGFKLVGTFHKSGCKFGQWYDMVWMEKMLGEHEENPQAVALGKWNA